MSQNDTVQADRNPIPRESEQFASLHLVDEAAALLRLNPEWLRQLIRTKKVGAHKSGGRWLIPQTEIDRRLGKLTTNAPTEHAMKNITLFEPDPVVPVASRRTTERPKPVNMTDEKVQEEFKVEGLPGVCAFRASMHDTCIRVSTPEHSRRLS